MEKEPKLGSPITLDLLAHVATAIFVNDSNVQAGVHSEAHIDRAIETAGILLMKCDKALNP